MSRPYQKYLKLIIIYINYEISEMLKDKEI